jgi:hypothetical protein
LPKSPVNLVKLGKGEPEVEEKTPPPGG